MAKKNKLVIILSFIICGINLGCFLEVFAAFRFLIKNYFKSNEPLIFRNFFDIIVHFPLRFVIILDRNIG